MKTSFLLSAALAMVVLPAPVAVVMAQSGGVEPLKANTRAAKRAREAKEKGATQAPAMFPAATREEPKQAGAPALNKQLTALFKAQEEGNDDDAIAKADAILADSRANAFDKSSANYVAGYAWLSKEAEGYANARKYIQAAIDTGGLSNNTHYQMMLQMAQMQTSDDLHAESLVTVDRYLAETKFEDPKAYGLKANVLYQMKRYADSAEVAKKAIAIKPDDNMVKLLVANYVELDRPNDAAKLFEDMLAKTPNDKNLMINLASVYQQAGDDAKAGQVFDRMRTAGLLTETRDYEVGYRLLANIDGRQKDALALINEGLEKGVLTPSYDMYAFQGQVYYDSDDIARALAAWETAAPLGKDGEMYLNVGKLHSQQEHWPQAKAAAQQALAKGVKKKGDAWLVVARSEFGMKNSNAVLAAYREAAKYPESKKAAEAALREASKK